MDVAACVRNSKRAISSVELAALRVGPRKPCCRGPILKQCTLDQGTSNICRWVTKKTNLIDPPRHALVSFQALCQGRATGCLPSPGARRGAPGSRQRGPCGAYGVVRPDFFACYNLEGGVPGWGTARGGPFLFGRALPPGARHAGAREADTARWACAARLRWPPRSRASIDTANQRVGATRSAKPQHMPCAWRPLAGPPRLISTAAGRAGFFV